jgi:hypothetical protein
MELASKTLDKFSEVWMRYLNNVQLLRVLFYTWTNTKFKVFGIHSCDKAMKKKKFSIRVT